MTLFQLRPEDAGNTNFDTKKHSAPKFEYRKTDIQLKTGQKNFLAIPFRSLDD